MKLTLLFLLLALLSGVAANSYSQSMRLTLKMENARIEEVLSRIEDLSKFRFFYNDEVDLEKRVSVNIFEGTLVDLLNEIFRNTEIQYEVAERQIILRSRNSPDSYRMQQQRPVSGKVTDSSGADLPGVTVVIKGTTQGTITGSDGRYSLAGVPANATLVFSFVGMQTLEIAIEGRTSVDARLEEETVGIEEVVAIGYGVQKKVNLTGAVSHINFEDESLQSRPLTNVSTALSGMSPGLFIRQGDGTPSSNSATISIRGVGSLNSSREPLVIVDGQPMDIDAINPHDIASISVLKDAASAAIYGSRSSNGVILITTKSGDDKGKIAVNYTGNIGFSEPTRLTDFITNTADHLTLINQIQKNSGLPAMYTQDRIDNWQEKSKSDILYPNTDWWDVFLKDNSIQNHNVSARGGNETVSFYTSLGYMNNNGIIDNTGFEKFNFRSNLNFKVNDWLKLGTNVSALFGKADPVSVDYLFRYFEANTPGNLPKYQDRYGAAMTGESPGNNPVAIVENFMGRKNTQEYTGKIFATLSPLKGLEINGSYFMNIVHYNDSEFLRPVDFWNFQDETIYLAADPNPSLSNSFSKQRNQILDLYASFKKTFGSHQFSILAGFNQEYYKREGFSASKTGLINYELLVFDAASTPNSIGGSGTDYATRSYFGRINYNFRDKYLAEANVRYDGSSRFSPGNRWGAFPSFSVGWRVSEEPFWRAAKSTIDYIKLRLSWGQLGNNGIGNYSWQDVYKTANYNFNGTIVEGMAPTAIANNRISWETTDVLNAGIDFNLFEKASFTFDYYNKLTHGILATLPIPYVNGGLTPPTVNSAKVRNSGLEGEVKYEARIGKLSVSASLNGTYNNNEIEKYKGKDFIESRNNATAWAEGEPIGIYYVREVDRIIRDKSEIDQLIADGWSFKPSTPGVGDFLYKNQNDDKKIDDKDRVLKGNPIPLFTYGGSFSLGYKNFDCYVLFNGVAQWDTYYKSAFNSLNHYVIGYLFPVDYLHSWSESNPESSIPRIYSNNTRNDQDSDFFLHKADYLRIKTIQFGYTIPPRFTNRAKLKNVRLYVNLENYFTFTSFPGMDPENDGSRYSSTFTYPLIKTLSFGMNVDL